MKLWTTGAGVRVPNILRWPGVQLDGTGLGLWLARGDLRRSAPLFWVYYNALNEQRAAMRDARWKVLARLESADGAPLPR